MYFRKIKLENEQTYYFATNLFGLKLAMTTMKKVSNKMLFCLIENYAQKILKIEM